LFNDVYKTISNPTEGVFKDKGSRFLAFAYPFAQEQDLKNIITTLKNEHSKARHFCFAYRLTADRNIFRINDDGEPSGTAGRPILNILLSNDLTNILVIVVRYFGGTLLGVPGLINAYKKATEDVISQAIIIEKTVQDIYQLSFDYLQMNDVMKLVKDDNLEITDQNFDLNCQMKIAINQSVLNKIIDKLEKIEALKSTYLYSI